MTECCRLSVTSLTPSRVTYDRRGPVIPCDVAATRATLPATVADLTRDLVTEVIERPSAGRRDVREIKEGATGGLDQLTGEILATGGEGSV